LFWRRQLSHNLPRRTSSLIDCNLSMISVVFHVVQLYRWGETNSCRSVWFL
jgi:hypothetical protein